MKRALHLGVFYPSTLLLVALSLGPVVYAQTAKGEPSPVQANGFDLDFTFKQIINLAGKPLSTEPIEKERVEYFVQYEDNRVQKFNEMTDAEGKITKHFGGDPANVRVVGVNLHNTDGGLFHFEGKFGPDEPMMTGLFTYSVRDLKWTGEITSK